MQKGIYRDRIEIFSAIKALMLSSKKTLQQHLWDIFLKFMAIVCKFLFTFNKFFSLRDIIVYPKVSFPLNSPPYVQLLTFCSAKHSTKNSFFNYVNTQALTYHRIYDITSSVIIPPAHSQAYHLFFFYRNFSVPRNKSTVMPWKILNYVITNKHHSLNLCISTSILKMLSSLSFLLEQMVWKKHRTYCSWRKRL